MAPRSGGMTTRPRVDVGVVTWNSADLTVQALRHLLDSDQGLDLNLLVHDNASSDGTAEAIRRHVPEARVTVADENLGFARAVNRLVAESDAPWFLALNSDAWPEPGTVATLVRTADTRSRAALVVPRLVRPDGSTEHSIHPFPTPSVALIDALGGRSWLPRSVLARRYLEGAWCGDHAEPVDWAVGAAWLLRRTAMEEIGGLDERFFMNVEDLEWCARARSLGWEVWYEPGAVVHHVGNASGERRFGDGRLALEAANLRVHLEETLGPRRAVAYRGLQATACVRQVVAATGRGDAAAASRWRLRAKTHLGLVATPLVGNRPGSPDAEPALADGAASSSDAPAEAAGPRVAVVVATHGRVDRLKRLLGALAAQDLPRDEFEVVVVDDASPDGTGALLAEAEATGTLPLRVLTQPVCRGPAAARNLGWRSSGARVIAFTDDDCVPDPGWLRAGLAALDGQARVAVGRTAPPADQLHLVGAPFSRVLQVDCVRFFETCNAFYRRRDLEAAGGFDERFRRPGGEDTRLGLDVVAAGVEPVFAGDAVVYHDVRPGGLRDALREAFRWEDIPLTLKGRPDARPALVHRWVFWKRTHPPAIAAAVGIALALRWRPALLLVLPWLVHRFRTDPPCSDPVLRVACLPGALAVDLCEVGVMVRGSIRHGTLLL
jgi:GT2 family glycosyltransferase